MPPRITYALAGESPSCGYNYLPEDDVGVERANHAGKRFNQRAFKMVSPSYASRQSCSITSFGITNVWLHRPPTGRSSRGSPGDPQLQVGLNHIALARLKFVLPLLPTARISPQNSWPMMMGLVAHRRVLFYGFHPDWPLSRKRAQAVGDHRREDFILLHFRKIKVSRRKSRLP